MDFYNNLTEYVVLDLETTGLSVENDDIIEIGAIKVSNESIVDEFQSFVHIDYELDPFITDLTGIRNSDLIHAPNLKNAIDKLTTFISDLPIVGHNITRFDKKFLLSAGLNLTGGTIDTLKLSQERLPELPHHRLKDLCKYFNVINEQSHRAIGDCKATYLCFKKLKNIAPPTPAEKLKLNNNADITVNYKVTGKIICLTGNFKIGNKTDISNFLENKGAVISKNVTKKTDYLISGCLENSDYKYDSYGTKIKRALELQEKGSHIRIINETDFFNRTNNGNDINDIKHLIDIVEKENNIHYASSSLTSFKVKTLQNKNVHSILLENSAVLKLSTMNKVFRITVNSNLIKNIIIPNSAKQKNSTSDTIHFDFLQKNNDYYFFIKAILNNAVKNYSGSSVFGCCHKYVECSDAKKCLHRDLLYARGCQYRKNLESGRIFYGKNKNI